MHFVQAKGILSQNNGMNIYRGCSHGCIYCDSRSKCYGFTHAFEDIEVKGNYFHIRTRVKIPKELFSTNARMIIQPGVYNVTREQMIFLEPLVFDGPLLRNVCTIMIRVKTLCRDMFR